MPYRWLLVVTFSELQSTPFVGCGVGRVGELVGRLVGRAVGEAEGREEGSKDGKAEGPEDGADDGDDVGSAEGNADGPDEGAGVATVFLVGVAEARATVGVGATRILRAGHFIIIIAIIFWLRHVPLPPALPSRSLGARIPRTALPAPSTPGGEAPAWTGSPPGDASAAATIVLEKGGESRARRKGAKTRISSDKREANEG
jgi:hypothetical protein